MLERLKSYFSSKKAIPDNVVFRLHYFSTPLLLALFFLLIGCKQYFGEPISCDFGGQVSRSVGDNFCFNDGVTTKAPSEEDLNRPQYKIKHRFYPYVPFFLLGSLILFYVPRLTWLFLESGRLNGLSHGMHEPSHTGEEEERRINRLIRFYDINHVYNGLYALGFYVCEALNLIHVIIQMSLVRHLLNDQITVYWNAFWYYYGQSGLYEKEDSYFSFGNNDDDSTSVHPLSDPDDEPMPNGTFFPKMGGCLVTKFGPSGTVEKMNGFCSLPLNDINQKMFFALWLWYLVLTVVTVLAFLGSVLAMIMPLVRGFLLSQGRNSHLLDSRVVATLSRSARFGDWFFLRHLAATNIDANTYACFLSLITDKRRKQIDVPIYVACFYKNAQSDEYFAEHYNRTAVTGATVQPDSRLVMESKFTMG